MDKFLERRSQFISLLLEGQTAILVWVYKLMTRHLLWATVFPHSGAKKEAKNSFIILSPEGSILLGIQHSIIQEKRFSNLQL